MISRLSATPVRLDKGRRVLAGILEADKSGYLMVVDDDDFVSCRLTRFVADHLGNNGWYVQNGYIWGDGGRLIYEYADFSEILRNIAHHPGGPVRIAGECRGG